MLDKITKENIDKVRQILVGKVSDPRSQVEQITNALLLKFMFDMDQESISIGGVASYYVKDFEKYAWKNFTDNKISGFDKVSLYSEALDKMYYNENLPETFREIFKNSTLPFKETSVFLKFIKVINEFKYDNSENLGDAFEYLLSFMGKQGEAGQFRTPRHIIDFVVEIVNPTKKESILDPASGTAGFLISAFKHILRNNKKKIDGDLLSVSDRNNIENNLFGYDISPEFLKVSLMNMFLHKFTNPKIFEYDTLSSEDRWNDYFDIILANPPFFSPKGGITPHNRFKFKSSRAELLFVDYIEEHLKPNGRAGIIIPEGVIFRNTSAHKNLRLNLIKNSLLGIISLPSGIFEPYTNQKTSVLILDKKKAKKQDFIFHISVKNDGFELNTNRNPIDANDLPEVIEIVKNENFENPKFVKKIKKKLIIDGNIHAHIGEIEKLKTTHNIVSLNSVADISSGNSAPQNQEFFKDGRFPFIRTSDVGKIKVGDIFEPRDYLNEKGIKKLKLFKKGTILFPKSGASTLLNHRVMMKIDGYVSSHLATIKAKNDKILDKFLFYILQKIDAKDLVPNPSYPSLNLPNIGEIDIPLPSLSSQKQIVDLLDNYQNTIDGCKKIINNIKPYIKIDPNWKCEKLENKIEFISGVTIKVNASKIKNGIPIITMADITENGEINTSKIRKIDLKNKNYNLLKKDDLIFNWRNGSKHLVGKTAYFDLQGEYVFASFSQGIRVKEELNPRFLWTILNQYRREGIYLKLMRESVNGLFNRDEIKLLEVPIPPIELQEEIVKDIEENMVTLKRTKEVLLKFENKFSNLLEEIFAI